MGAPNITYSITNNKLSTVDGFDHISVTFSADAPYKNFECRATKVNERWGVGVGELIVMFTSTPSYTQRTFEIYDDYLVHGNGEYRISLYVQGVDGSWNDTVPFIPDLSTSFVDASGKTFLCRKE